MVSTYIFSSKGNIWKFAPKPGQFFSLKKSIYTLALHGNIFTFGTPTKRQVLKRPYDPCSMFLVLIPFL
jgi:hypothetical protein